MQFYIRKVRQFYIQKITYFHENKGAWIGAHAWECEADFSDGHRLPLYQLFFTTETSDVQCQHQIHIITVTLSTAYVAQSFHPSSLWDAPLI